jgi:hypothetical protein
MEKKVYQMIGITMIREKRGIQRNRSQIRVLEIGRVHKKIVLKMRDIIGIGVKRGTHWNKSQISVPTRLLHFFCLLLCSYTPA